MKMVPGPAFVDYSPEDISPEDYSPGVETFDQFSQIYFKNAYKDILTTSYYR